MDVFLSTVELEEMCESVIPDSSSTRLDQIDTFDRTRGRVHQAKRQILISTSRKCLGTFKA